jgi:hypothetical protein
MRKKVLRAALAVVMGVIAVGRDAVPRAVAADTPGTGCKESPALVGQYFSVHGRLSGQANGGHYLRPAASSHSFWMGPQWRSMNTSRATRAKLNPDVIAISGAKSMELGFSRNSLNPG